MMTYEEQQIYNKLTPAGKRAFDRDKQDYPGRSFSQHLAKAKILADIDRTIDVGGDIEKTDVLKDVLTQAKKWLMEIGGISVAILSALDDAISKLGKAIGEGIRWIGNKLGDLFDWIFG